MSSNILVTPLENYLILAKKLDLETVLIKREDTQVSGSHKDRALYYMFDNAVNSGEKSFVISSSGNAAISAAHLANNVFNKDIERLDIFISPTILESKKQRLNKVINNVRNIYVHESLRAKSDAIKYAKEHDSFLMRTSTNDHALRGYVELAQELVGQLSHIQGAIDVFIPTSSGTTLQGLYNGLDTQALIPSFVKTMAGTRTNKRMVFRLHAVQTSRCYVMAKEFDSDFEPSITSRASAIVDTIAHRKDNVMSAIKKSRGGGWVINDNELQEARRLLEENTDIKNASWDSLLSLAGLIKTLKNGNAVSHALLLFTGV